MSEIDISVIILEYKSLEDLAPAIDSIKSGLASFNHEIIISSNSCYEDEKKEALKLSFPDIIWLFNKDNKGFAYGMNQGLKKARGKYMITMNSDVKILSGFQDMFHCINTDDLIGIVGPQIINNDGIIQDSFRTFLNPWSFLRRQLRRVFNRSDGLEKKLKPDQTQQIDWLSGAFLMTRKESYIKTGGMDENYFMYAEDMDWCYRTKLEGYKIIYFPGMQICYEGSRKARKLSIYTWVFIRSHFVFWNKFGYFRHKINSNQEQNIDRSL